MKTPVFFMIAGEASGDLLGARLMRALKRKRGEETRFVGIGGPEMQAEGLELLFPHTELMHFGVVEVVRHIPGLLARIDQTVQAVLDVRPTAVISIDSPDFCFRVAEKIRKKAGDSVRLIHYVAPTVWAWRPGRAKKIAKFLDHLLAVLPFEPPYFSKEGLGCTFVGHSVVESGADKGDGRAFRERRGIPDDAMLLTVLPGSRMGEISRLMPVFKDTVRLLAQKHPGLHIALPAVSHLRNIIADSVLTWDAPVHIVEGEKEKFDAFAASTAALACSGTVALELALARLPSVIAYKVNKLTYYLFKSFIRVSYVNLVNLMHNERVVPELLQFDCTPENLFASMDTLLTEKSARKEQISKLEKAAEWLGHGRFVPSEQAAETVLRVIEPPAVLQIIPALVTGGVERGVVETVEALVKNGFRAIVASSGGPMATEVEAAGGKHIALPLASKNPLIIAINVFRLAKIIRANDISIVHARSRAPAWSAYFAAKKTNAIFVTTFHSAYNAKTKIKRLYNSIMAKGERVIAISDFVAEYARTTYGIPEQILRIIPRGVDTERFDPEKISVYRVNDLRKEWKINDATPVILMPGRLTRWKGQTLLVRALSLIKRRDFRCVIVGGGIHSPFGRELSNAIDKAGLTTKVSLFDACRDMPAAYSLADVVVAPSTRPEGFGRIVIEAQAMGAPVIAANHGGAKETVLQGETGWLTIPGDPEDLAQAIDRALDLSSADKKSLARCARAHICSRYTMAMTTSKTLEIYRELLQKRPIH